MRLRRRAFTAMLRQEMGWFDQPANRYNQAASFISQQEKPQ
jgi:hypothetical protein